jgi:hypothetical protein
MVHLEAGRAWAAGHEQGGAAQTPGLRCASTGWLVLPLAALVYLLFAGYTPLFAGTVGLALVIVLILGHGALAAMIGPFAFRVVFWIALGLAAAASSCNMASTCS